MHMQTTYVRVRVCVCVCVCVRGLAHISPNLYGNRFTKIQASRKWLRAEMG